MGIRMTTTEAVLRTTTLLKDLGYDVSSIPPYARYNKILVNKGSESRLLIISLNDPDKEGSQTALTEAIADLSKLGYTIPMLHEKGIQVDLVLWYKDNEKWQAEWRKDNCEIT